MKPTPEFMDLGPVPLFCRHCGVELEILTALYAIAENGPFCNGKDGQVHEPRTN